MNSTTDPTSFVVFLITVIGAVGGVWWRIESAIRTAKGGAITQTNTAKAEAVTKAEAAYALAALVQAQLAEHKLHVAETYITKAGLRETTEQIINAVNGVKTDVHGLNERIDRIIEHQQPARPRRTS